LGSIRHGQPSWRSPFSGASIDTRLSTCCDLNSPHGL
jgi:hypothetical protein